MDETDKVEISELNSLVQQFGEYGASKLIFLTKEKEIEAKQLKKKLLAEKEIKDIENAIAAGNYQTKRDRVAGILNMYPDTRNSDMALTIKYWELFEEDRYHPGHLTSFDLFKLERLTTIARIRAKIQNEYGLFLGNQDVQSKRRQREEEVKAEMLADIPARRIVDIFADETGKNGAYVIVGSLWFLDVRKTLTFQNKILAWKRDVNWKHEFHFSECRKNDLECYKKFIDILADNREYIGFKFIAFKREGSPRKIDEIVERLYSHLIIKGISHEIEGNRVALPRQLDIKIDQAESFDSLWQDDLLVSLNGRLHSKYGNDVSVGVIQAIDSKHSVAIQAADLISGAMNRVLNTKAEEKNHKDELAAYILEKLELHYQEDGSEDDSSVLITI